MKYPLSIQEEKTIAAIFVCVWRDQLTSYYFYEFQTVQSRTAGWQQRQFYHTLRSFGCHLPGGFKGRQKKNKLLRASISANVREPETGVPYEWGLRLPGPAAHGNPGKLPLLRQSRTTERSYAVKVQPIELQSCARRSPFSFGLSL